MFSSDNIRAAFKAALPIMLGYVAIGIPCGILSASIGLNALQVFLMCALFYSGAGQFMIPNMWITGAPIASIILSVSFVNTRQMLYSAAFAPWCEGVSKKLAFWFSATVTDESFGVNMQQFEQGIIGNAIGIPLAIASFAMTSIFICLLVTQKLAGANIVAAIMAIVGVFVCKLIGLSGPAIFFGALFGVLCAFVFSRIRERV